MYTYKFATFTEAALTLANELFDNGQVVETPRTGKFLELKNLIYSVNRPCERLIPFKSLNQVKLWCYGEVLTEFLGLNPPLMEQYTNPKVKEFMESFHRGDGRQNYLYGERWHNNQSFQHVISTLLNDRYSRQAVMNIWDSSIDLNGSETNIPCTIIHQFMIRKSHKGDELTTNVYIRSNDFCRGFKYDIFLNSFIHEAFAGFLKCKPGELIFHVGSFHIYERDYKTLNELIKEKPVRITQQPRFTLDFEDLYSQLWMVYHIQNKSRYDVVAQSDFQLDPIFTLWANDYIHYNEINNHRKLGN